MPEPLPFWRANFNSSDLVIMDTSFVMDLLELNESKSRAQECADTLHSIGINKALAAFIFLVPLEMYNAIFQNKAKEAIKSEYNSIEYNQKALKRFSKDNPEEYRKIVEESYRIAQEAMATLKLYPQVYDQALGMPGQALVDASMTLQSKYLFPGTNDPTHLAIAVSENATYFATTDRDYLVVNEPNLHILVDDKLYKKYYNK